MKIVFFSNFINHHQLPLCEAFYKLTGGNFTFVATTRIPRERLKLGYQDMNSAYSFVLRAYDGETEERKARQLAMDADVLIAGSTPEHFLRERIRAKKLIFRYAERPLKNGFEPIKYLPRLIRWHWRNPMSSPIYLLCASAYTAGDYAKFGLFRNRGYRWGYFPEVKRYEDTEELLEKKTRSSILWAGRFIDWKHPEHVVEVARRLKENGYVFSLTMLGNGELLEQTQQQVKMLGLEDYVSVPGSVPAEDVRAYMEAASVYLFTSDRNEGWGAVLNESMNSGCAVVACDAIGSVPFLLKNGENGLTYSSGEVDELYRQVKYLLENPDFCHMLGRKAYETIATQWNAAVAAERLVKLSEALLQGQKHPVLYENGPCSKAEILRG